MYEEFEEENDYSEDSENLMDSDAISANEEAFMRGYDEADALGTDSKESDEEE